MFDCKKIARLAVLASLALPASFTFAQDQGGGGGGGGNQNDNGGNRRDPAQMRQRMMERVKEQMGATDEEMQVLTPKIEKVAAAQRDARPMGGMMGRRGGPGGGGPGGGGPGANPDAPQSAVAKATAELRTTLQNKDASDEAIEAQLLALRDARAKAVVELQTAQKELKEVITPRQEAVLVTMGMLD